MATLTNVAVRDIEIYKGAVTERSSWKTWSDFVISGFRDENTKSTVQFRAYLSEPCTSITLKVTPYNGVPSNATYYFKASANEQDPVLELGALNVTATEYDVKNTDSRADYRVVTVTINGNFKAGWIYVYAWASNTNFWLTGNDDYPTKITEATSAPAYTLSLSQGANSTISVSRTASNFTSTGALATGATIYNGDKLKITFTAATGYNVSTHTVNDSTFTSGSTHTVSGNVAVVSTATIIQYNISYDANGGSGAPSTQTKNYGTNLTLSSTKPIRTGYTFQGWGTSSTDTSVDYAAGSTYSKNEAITLYAIWQINTYNINYNVNGGSGSVESQTKTYGIPLELTHEVPTAPASFFKTGYTVTFNANSGTCDILSLESQITTKYTFSTWNTKADGSGTSYASGATYTANNGTTLYAQWETTDSNNAITLPTPVRTNYIFEGWSTDINAASGSFNSYTPSEDITLYAIWSLDPSAGLVYIHNGTDWDAYELYIYSGTTWEKHIPYVNNGIDWELI